MGDYCLRFNAAAQEVHALTAENELFQKRIAELEEGMSKAYELIRPYKTHPGLFREVTDILEDCLQAEEMRYISEGGADE